MSILPLLFQAEWCPHSHRVRERLTDLGVDFVARQVPRDRDDRERMRSEVGSGAIPVIVFPDGSVVEGDDAILQTLDGRCGDGRTA